jgi:uncharacterized coiled-coil protein SlyX
MQIFEGMPVVVQIILGIVVALGGRELVVAGWKEWRGKRKANAQLDGLHLSNTGTALDELRDAIVLVGKLRKDMEEQQAAMEANKAIIAALKDDKIADDREKARKDGVIAEQRQTIKGLYDDIAELRIKEEKSQGRITALEKQVKILEEQLDRMNQENYQLKAMVEKQGERQDAEYERTTGS